MKNLFLTLLSSIILISCSDQQTVNNSSPLSVATPESQGISSERLGRIDEVLANAVDEGRIPGAVALVARNGKIVYHKAVGMADNESGRAMKTDDIFRIASMTKAVTATAVMILWEEGRFRLDDPVSKYIPEFKNPVLIKTFDRRDTTYTTVAAGAEITDRKSVV